MHKLDALREQNSPKESKRVGSSTWIILIIAISLIILSVSLILSLIIRHCFSKLKKDRRTKLHRNVERSGMVDTDQEKRPEQQIELKPIDNIATQQATNTPKEPLQLPSVEILPV